MLYALTTIHLLQTDDRQTD